MQKRTALYISLIILVAWCIFIFYMSSRVADDSDAMSLGVVYQIIAAIVPGYDQMSATEQLVQQSSLNHIVRKLAHFSEYTLLGMLSLNMAWQIRRSGARKKRPATNPFWGEKIWPLALTGWAFATLYAASDEIHQIFVAGRSCQFTDVCIDSSGALTGIVLVLIVVAIVHARRKKVTK